MSYPTPEQIAFTPKPSRGESKADLTNQVARAILDEQVTRREEKTAKLRAARLAHEAKQELAPPPVKQPTKRKPKNG